MAVEKLSVSTPQSSHWDLVFCVMLLCTPEWKASSDGYFVFLYVIMTKFQSICLAIVKDIYHGSEIPEV